MILTYALFHDFFFLLDELPLRQQLAKLYFFFLQPQLRLVFSQLEIDVEFPRMKPPAKVLDLGHRSSFLHGRWPVVIPTKRGPGYRPACAVQAGLGVRLPRSVTAT